MPVIETKGAASSGGFGQFARQVAANYIEDVFSTYLIKTPGSVTPVGAVNNGIDLSTKGGMVWLKDRLFAGYNHTLVDTARGPTKRLISNTSAAEADTSTYGFTSFNTNGFTLAAGGGVLFDNGGAGTNVVTWTFRKQAKFFDVVTYTGNGANRTIAHNLGSVPGCIMVKRIDGYGGDWVVYHRSLSNTQGVYLNQTAAAVTNSTFWNSTTPTSTNFALGTSTAVNATDGLGGTYVAYLFAHDAGGFGAVGTDNVISCGSFTAGTEVNLGWEPQWLLVKQSNGTGPWELIDNMRGFFAAPSTETKYLVANTSGVEQSWGGEYYPTATGFKAGYTSGTYIYIAIRRGPMRTPTSGTSVFKPVIWTGSTGSKDMGSDTSGWSGGVYVHVKMRDGTQVSGDFDSLRGLSNLYFASGTSGTDGEVDYGPTGFGVGASNQLTLLTGSFWGGGGDGTGKLYVAHLFRRAPGFFDVVCWTGNGTSQNLSHNLQVAPTLIFCKQRSLSGESWATLCSEASSSPDRRRLFLNSASAGAGLNSYFSNAGGTPVLPTSSVFTVGPNDSVNTSGQKYVAYLFATLAGVSKVGAYTGTGATQQINCGFTGGARYVMIKRTDSTGDWYAWDSARGIVAGDDPYLLLNSAVAEVTNTDYIDTLSTGFEISSTAPAAINANGGSYIFLAIA